MVGAIPYRVAALSATIFKRVIPAMAVEQRYGVFCVAANEASLTISAFVPGCQTPRRPTSQEIDPEGRYARDTRVGPLFLSRSPSGRRRRGTRQELVRPSIGRPVGHGRPHAVLRHQTRGTR